VLAGERRNATPTNVMTKHRHAKSEVRAEQAAGNKYQTIKLGLDVHADSIVVARIVENSAPQPAQRFKPADFLKWVRSQVGQAEQVHSCYEAGPFGFVLHRQLSALGIHNVVMQPVCLDERHKKVNHDKSDAREIAQRLDRYVAGNTKALATVRVPTSEEEQKRIETRLREQLKRAVLRVTAQGRSLLLSQGYREKGGWWEGRRWDALQAKLPVWLLARLEVFRRVLQTLHTELKAATTAIEVAAPALRPKGLGGLTYEIVEREVVDWQRFANRRQVGSYTGLCGGVSASGGTHRLLSITKHGNVRLRTALVELAWRMVVWQPQSKLVRKWWPILGSCKATRAARKKAIVAMARQLAVDLWRWRTGRVSPEQLGWIMVGH
jgi:transposase